MKTKSQRKLTLLKPLFWVVSFGVVSFLVFLTIELSTVGAELANLQEEVTDLTDRKRFLSEEIARSNSLNSFEETAENLGFIKPQKILYITDDEGIATKLP